MTASVGTRQDVQIMVFIEYTIGKKLADFPPALRSDFVVFMSVHERVYTCVDRWHTCFICNAVGNCWLYLVQGKEGLVQQGEELRHTREQICGIGRVEDNSIRIHRWHVDITVRSGTVRWMASGRRRGGRGKGVEKHTGLIS